MLGLDVHVREGAPHGTEEVLEALGAGSLEGDRVVVYDVGSHYLVYDVEVAADYSLRELLLSCDIVLARHNSLSFLLSTG